MENNSLNESYLNYGDSKISQNDFLNAASSNLEDYLSQLSWSNKRKQMFRDAYSDIMSQGVTGATNTSGFWEITHNGNNIDLSSRSKKEQEMYGEAAYYIQLLMNKLVSSNKELKEKAKSEKSLFDNKYFTEHLNDYIGRNRFGGRDWTTNDYNELDTRGKNGLRDTTNRRALLSRMLQGYADSLKEEDLNFEGSPFTDLNDFRTRVNSVIESLNNNSPDLKEKLDSIGLRYSDWFNDGSNDPFQKDGYTGTYGEYYGTYLPKQEKLKQKELEKKQKTIDKENYDNTLILKFTNPKMLGATSTFLKTKYGNDSNKLRAQLLDYALNDITKLTPDLQSELHGAYKYLAKDSIDDKTLKRLQSSFRGTYKNSPPNRFKKINGIDNLIWDSLRRLVIQINTRKQLENILNLPADLFNGVKTPQELQKELLTTPRGNGSELTRADYIDIGATLADLTALVSPGLITGTAASVAAAGARTWNRVTEKGLWDGIINWDNALDWGTSILGGTPLWGDATSFAKFARGFGKLMTIPAVINAFQSVPEAKAAWDKIDSNNLVESLKKLTPADYHAMASVLTGVIGGRNYFRSNLAEREVIKHSGYTKEQINASKGKIRQYAEKYGVLRTKVPKGDIQSKTDVVKVKVNGTDKEIEISPEVKSRIKKAVNKAGNKEADRNNAVEKILKDEKLIAANDKITVLAPQKISDSKLNPIRNITRTTNEIFGTKNNSSLLIEREEGDFENWLTTRSNWNKWKYGTNKNLKDIRDRLNLPKSTSKLQLLQGEETPKTTETKSNWSLEKIDKYLKNLEQMENSFLNRSKYNPSSKSLKKIDLSKNISPEKYSLADGKQLELSIDNGILNIKGPDGINISLRISDQLLIKKVVSDIIKNYNNSIGRSSAIIKRFSKEYIESLKELRRKGYLFKQGGTIDKQKIQKYKEFIKK